ncbi:hypothetical protein BX070DRAFT_227899 [Coemansia spiralis]|nr:hypothetical protein BX070DRAFT_227899 [Coemansia spiralis]
MCLSRAWAARHHFECPEADPVAAAIKPVFRASLRMAARASKVLETASARPRWLRVQIAAWARLVGHREKHPKYVLNQYREIASALANTGLTEDELVTMLCRFGCNNFASHDDQNMHIVGHLCSPLVSLLFNHSCFPNATFVYVDGKQSVRLLHDVCEGEEITLAYIDGLSPRDNRQKLLKDVYFFSCTCIKCTGVSARGQIDSMLSTPCSGLPKCLPTDYAQRLEIDQWVEQIVTKAMELVVRGSVAEDIGQFVLDSIGSAVPEDVSFAAYKHWLECQDECLERVSGGDDVWGWANLSSLYVLAFYIMAYPLHHPMVGRQCLEAAKIAWNCSVSGSKGPLCERPFIEGLALVARSIFEVSANLDDSSVDSPLSLRQQIDQLLGQLSVK